MRITIRKLMEKVKKLSYNNRIKIFGTAHNGVISTMIALNKEHYNKILNNMDYKLAKQLKDAGFPQRTFDVETHYAGKCFEDRCYIPTLSELIDACGLEIWSLERIVINLKQKWYANYECSGVPKTNGKTPEEAVAKLWIKLNKK